MSRLEGGRRLREGVPDKTPLVSVISVVFRAAKELPPLLESIIKNKGEDCELIVIDGGSDDGTVDVLRGYGDAIDYWLSEPDRGIYDAMNKGVASATGEFVLHMNAGDRLLMIPRTDLRECLADGVDVACYLVDKQNWGEHRPRLGWLIYIDNPLHQQGEFYRRSTHPGYDPQYRMAGDFDCNQRLFKSKGRFRLFRRVVAEVVDVGVSGTQRYNDEKYRVIRKNFGLFPSLLSRLWDTTEGSRVVLKHLLTRIESRNK